MSSVLLDKSLDNDKTGKWAEASKMYHVAISSYYYALYQKLIHISKRSEYILTFTDCENSHKNFICNFLEFAKIKNLKAEDYNWLARIHDLRRFRHKADYTGEEVTNQEYSLGFKTKYNCIIQVIDNIVDGDGK